jgi:hypothetical protein
VSTSSRPIANGSASALARVRWKGEETFRTLSYYFSIRWNAEAAGEHVRRTLGNFVAPRDPSEYAEPRTPGLPPQYSIVKSGRTYTLFFGDGTLRSNNRLGVVLGRLFWHVNQHTIRRTGDFLLIHAGAVSTPGGEGILLPARSGGGKTTLTTALVRAGFQYLSDDAAPVDPVTGTLYPYPKAISLKEGPVPVFPDLYASRKRADWVDGHWIRPTDIRPGAVGGPCRIRFVVAHEYRPGAPTHVAPLTAAQGAMELLNNALNLFFYRSRALPLVADVARGARSYRMISGDLDDAVRAITELTNGRPERGNPGRLAKG